MKVGPIVPVFVEVGAENDSQVPRETHNTSIVYNMWSLVCDETVGYTFAEAHYIYEG